MTAAPEDSDLGLNLVFSTGGGGSGNGPSSGSGDTTNHNKQKRKTKYDRRREKGRLAKLAKEEEKKDQQQQQRVGGGGGRKQVEGRGGKEGPSTSTSASSLSSLAGIAAAFGGSTSKSKSSNNGPKSKLGRGAESPVAESTAFASKEKESTVKEVSSEKASTTNNKIEKSEAEDAPSPSVTQSSAKEEANVSVTNENDDLVVEKADPKPPSSSSGPSMVTVQQQQPPAALSSTETEDTIVTSRKHRAQTSLTEEQQDQYYSEFHARPRDLDRSERASRDIKASCASDHIFGHQGGNDDDGEDAEMKDDGEKEGSNNKDKSEMETNTSSSSCPFQNLGLHSNLVSALTSPTGKFKLSQPTIVQSQSIAALLPSQNRRKGKKNNNKHNKQKLEQNLFVQSETGSGKTLAYLLPILQHLAVNAGAQSLKKVDRQLGGTRTIILLPTRELATQTYTVANALCSKSFSWIVPGCFSGGEKRKSEKARLRKGISILIATPGRLLDHLSKTESLLSALKNKLEWLVLDEADRLLDAGLGGQVEQIVQYLRSNQPRAGPKRDGVTWRSILVSATVTKDLEGLAKTALGGDGWMWARGHAADKQLTSKHNSSSEDAEAPVNGNNELDNAAPRQLAQLYMVVSAKLRLSSLVAFLSARAAKGERVVVFMSTCDSVDYHHALFNEMECILGDKDENDDTEIDSAGLFGKKCPIYKLHGDIPHNKRQATIKSFNDDSLQSSILLATDVAARGLNFPSLDWIVQYDPPCETKDYVHRAGRSARAGAAGHALLFLLPSERQYVEVLQLRGLKEISALSLGSTLGTASGLCKAVAREGESKAGGNTFADGRGEAFTLAVQNRMEQCIIQNDVDYKAAIKKKAKGDPKEKRRKQRKDAVGPLLEGARKAFSAFVRAYPAKEKAVRHIFNARALHLGHIARSLALKETPKMVSKAKAKAQSGNANRNAEDESSGKGQKRNSRLAFGDKKEKQQGGDEDDENAGRDDERDRNLSLLGAAIGGDINSTNKRPKSSSGGRASGGGRDVQQRMMERAMMMQGQEFM